MISTCGIQGGRDEGTCVGHQIAPQAPQKGDRLVGLGQPVQHKVAADEAGAAGDENGHVALLVLAKLIPTSPLKPSKKLWLGTKKEVTVLIFQTAFHRF
jgi:hypothetical protein